MPERLTDDELPRLAGEHSPQESPMRCYADEYAAIPVGIRFAAIEREITAQEKRLGFAQQDPARAPMACHVDPHCTAGAGGSARLGC
jgi:hypothetical protein